MQLAGRDHGGGAAVHVIADPADGVLGRRPFAEHRMDVAVDQARHDGALACIQDGVGLGVGGRIERRDFWPSINSDVTAACGLAMSPVKNSPMFLMRSVDTVTYTALSAVMPGFMPGIHVFRHASKQDVDGQETPADFRR